MSDGYKLGKQIKQGTAMEFIETPKKQYNVARSTGGKVNKMTKTTKTETPAKVYAPSRMEVAKTVIIFIMFTAVVAFMAGMQFQKNQNAEIDRAVKSAQVTVAPELK